MMLDSQQAIRAAAERPGTPDRGRVAAAAAKAGDVDALYDLVGLLLRGAVSAPSDLTDAYDGAAEGWLGSRPNAAPIPSTSAQVEVPEEFWTAFWELVLDPATGSDALDITTRTAALSGMVAPELQSLVADAALAYPGVTDAADQGMPIPFTLDALSRCPAGSLGSHIHSLIVDNGFDLEVLDRSTLGFDDLIAPLGYLNSRILQCHDLWHQLAGYQTTILHEVAISGFQLGQFGHHYSSMFLAVTLTKASVARPEGVPLLLDTILSAWVHGRETPSLLGIPWEQVWDRTPDDIRAEYGIAVYASPYPADLIEQLLAA
ncbi:MAG: Coq4 family protein [Ilumatobacteraceae bacterium]